MANELNNPINNVASMNKANPNQQSGPLGQIINGGLAVAGNGWKLMNVGSTAASAVAGAKKVTSDFSNAVANNKYHDKFAEEKDESAEKTKKRKDIGKYVPHLVGATLLTAAVARSLQTGDATQPFQDVRDGFKRIPAQVVNSFKKGTKVTGAAIKGATKGAAAGIKATTGAPAPKVNNSFLSNVSLGLARGTGQVLPFLAGAAYIDHKTKDAKKKAERQEQLQAIHQSTEPLPLTAARAAGQVGKQYLEANTQKTASVRNIGGIDWENNGKDLLVDAYREAVPKALAAAGILTAAQAAIKSAKKRTARSIADTAEDYVSAVRSHKERKERDMEKSAEVLHPKDRSSAEKAIRTLITTGTIAAATLPAAVATEAMDRYFRKKSKKKEEEERMIERKYRALQRHKEGGTQYAGQQFRNHDGHPRSRQPKVSIELNISGQRRQGVAQNR